MEQDLEVYLTTVDDRLRKLKKQQDQKIIEGEKLKLQPIYDTKLNEWNKKTVYYKLYFWFSQWKSGKPTPIEKSREFIKRVELRKAELSLIEANIRSIIAAKPLFYDNNNDTNNANNKKEQIENKLNEYERKMRSSEQSDNTAETNNKARPIEEGHLISLLNRYINAEIRELIAKKLSLYLAINELLVDNKKSASKTQKKNKDFLLRKKLEKISAKISAKIEKEKIKDRKRNLQEENENLKNSFLGQYRFRKRISCINEEILCIKAEILRINAEILCINEKIAQLKNEIQETTTTHEKTGENPPRHRRNSGTWGSDGFKKSHNNYNTMC